MHLEWTYGKDKTGQGFFCPELPQKRHDYFVLKLLRPAEAEAVYQCRPGSKIGSIFLASEFRYFEPPTGLDNLEGCAVTVWAAAILSRSVV